MSTYIYFIIILNTLSNKKFLCLGLFEIQNTFDGSVICRLNHYQSHTGTSKTQTYSDIFNRDYVEGFELITCTCIHLFVLYFVSVTLFSLNTRIIVVYDEHHPHMDMKYAIGLG